MRPVYAIAFPLAVLSAALSILAVPGTSPAGDEVRKPVIQADSAQVQPEKQVYFQDPIVVTATRTERSIFGLPRTVSAVSDVEIRRGNKLSILDALNGTIGVWVEKRTATTSDPVVRGMSGYNVLALVDGNTLSTLWGEGGMAGDDMYGKIDADNVARIEVVRGPGSVLYGSNALAGVLNFIPKRSPITYTQQGYSLGAETKLAYASAAQEKRLRTEVFGASPRLRFLAGISRREAKDARAGRGIGLQVPSSGKDLNWEACFSVRLAELHSLEFSYQDTDRDEIHRFYRPYEDNYNDRVGASVRYRGSGLIADNDDLLATVYYQYKKDTRKNLQKNWTGWAITRAYTSDVQWSYAVMRGHYLTSGLHYEIDDGESPDDEQFTRQTGDVITKDAPDSRWQDYAFYLQDEWNLATRCHLILGARWDHFDFESRVDPFYRPPAGFDPLIDQIDEQEHAITGGIGVLYSVTSEINAYVNASRGFRQYAPMFGVKQHAYGIQVPSGLLNPASSLNSEVGLKLKSQRARACMVGYYTDLDNFPVVVRSAFLGKDWYDWDNSGTHDAGEDVYVTRNAARAYVYGTEIEGEYRIARGWSAYGGFSWNYGQDVTNDQPLRHTIPAWGVIKLAWEEPKNRRIWAEISAEMAGDFTRIPADRVQNDPGYRVNPQDMSSPLMVPNGGLPGWTVYNLRGEYALSPRLRLNFAVENLTDRAYRRAHSRWDEMGINFIAGVTLRT